jgi:hypothetical protein
MSSRFGGGLPTRLGSRRRDLTGARPAATIALACGAPATELFAPLRPLKFARINDGDRRTAYASAGEETSRECCGARLFVVDPQPSHLCNS